MCDFFFFLIFYFILLFHLPLSQPPFPVHPDASCITLLLFLLFVDGVLCHTAPGDSPGKQDSPQGPPSHQHLQTRCKNMKRPPSSRKDLVFAPSRVRAPRDPEPAPSLSFSNLKSAFVGDVQAQSRRPSAFSSAPPSPCSHIKLIKTDEGAQQSSDPGPRALILKALLL